MPMKRSFPYECVQKSEGVKIRCVMIKKTKQNKTKNIRCVMCRVKINI